MEFIMLDYNFKRTSAASMYFPEYILLQRHKE